LFKHDWKSCDSKRNYLSIQAGTSKKKEMVLNTYFLDQLERLSSVRFFGGPLDERPQLLRHFVANQTESRHARLVVRNHVPRFESAASERVEILARIHRLVHIFQDLGRFDLEFKLVDFHTESRWDKLICTCQDAARSVANVAVGAFGRRIGVGFGGLVQIENFVTADGKGCGRGRDHGKSFTIEHYLKMAIGDIGGFINQSIASFPNKTEKK
jgi:hypothetical protein